MQLVSLLHLQQLSVTIVDVRRIPLRVTLNKAAGPHNIPGHVLKQVPVSSL